MRLKQGFTLIEVLLVLTVVALVLVFGFVGVTRIQQSLEIQSGYNDIVSYIQSLQNQALNSQAESSGSAPDVYAIEFDVDANQYSRLTCDKVSPTSDNLSCNTISADDEDLKPSGLSNVTYDDTFSGSGDCNRFGFLRSSGEIVRINSSDTLTYGGTCTITVSHTDRTSVTRDIIINFAENSIEVED